MNAFPRLDVRGLGVTRGENTILSSINLSLRPGELVALLGPSGSGKSTLLKSILGIVPASGKVELGGQDLWACFDQLRTQVGYVPQDEVLHHSLTVEDSVRYTAQLRLPALPEDRLDGAVTAVLAETGLLDRRLVRIRSLSGGQRKRVSVALELLARPVLFFLDEPTSGLDPALEAQLMDLLRKLTGPERLTLVTTHVMASLDRVDLAVIVAGGRLVYVGPPREAPAFFGVGGVAEIYKLLTKEGAKKFNSQLLASPYYRTYVLERLAEPMDVSRRVLKTETHAAG